MLSFAMTALSSECIPRHYGKSSFVCVCGPSYCDSAPTVGPLLPGQATLISSTRADARFRQSNLSFGGLSNSLIGTLN